MASSLIVGRPCDLFLWKSEEKWNEKGKKFGLGSSGSVVVLVVKALLALYDVSVDQELLFKLASAVLLKRGDNGSMGDLAMLSWQRIWFFTSHLIARKWLLGWKKKNLATVFRA